MGKVQCELLISFESISSNQVKYQGFSQFIYELTKGKFGVLA